MNDCKRCLLTTEPRISFTLIRVMVGAVFLSEGIQKFLYEFRGVGRFRDEIGLPWPEFLGQFVAFWEMACGALILLGILTRLAVVPTIIIMTVALCTTKFPRLAHPENTFMFNFWGMAHAMRTDWSMLIGSIFLLINGGGRWSLDSLLAARHASTPEPHAASR